jgi:hypothetical protein
MIRTEHNVETGEIIQIELTAKEIKEIEAMQEISLTKSLERQLEEKTKAIAKADLLAKLGITAEEAKLLLS